MQTDLLVGRTAVIATKNILIVDVDGTLCPIKSRDQSYADLTPEPRIVEKLRKLADQGWRIVIQTARGMRTYDGNAGEIAINVAPVLLDWLKRHDIPFHELHVAKPWPGANGFYIDDRAVRPREFLDNTFEGLEEICRRDRLAGEGEMQDS
ncbi:capsular biosynthesis protein [Rhodoblastus acidophilus]|nr:capsular biosynthesis protein [Rhodoblastus acidophilus]RAI23065.1 capsular biosynthesis protein [Rhodoblastus acidophilus]